MIGLAFTGCRPTLLDGAFDGNADCDNSGNHTISALFDEQRDGDVDGQFYIENIDFFFGAEVTLRANLDNAEYDAEDDEYTFDLQADDDNDPEFSGKLALDADDPDDADGEIDQFDADSGDVVDTCELSLTRVSRTDN